jgi:hypothetical protein
MGNDRSPEPEASSKVKPTEIEGASPAPPRTEVRMSPRRRPVGRSAAQSTRGFTIGSTVGLHSVPKHRRVGLSLSGADLDIGVMVGVVAYDRGRVGATLVDRDLPRGSVSARARRYRMGTSSGCVDRSQAASRSPRTVAVRQGSVASLRRLT